MSKSSKTKSAEKRKAEKRKRKAAMKALYESYKAAGTNSKRTKRAAKQKRMVKKFKHPLGKCGNIGCDACQGRTKQRSYAT